MRGGEPQVLLLLARTGDMLGLGSLTLPAVFARLGWALALAVIVLCVVGTLYSGRLFTLLAVKARALNWGLHNGTRCRLRALHMHGNLYGTSSGWSHCTAKSSP